MRQASGRLRASWDGVLLTVVGVLAVAVQVCPRVELSWSAALVVPTVPVLVASSPLVRLPRAAVSGVLVVQAGTHLACAVGLVPHASPGLWHLGVAAMSVLLVHVGGQSLLSVLATSALRWARRVELTPTPPRPAAIADGGPHQPLVAAACSIRRGRAPPSLRAVPVAV